MDNNCSAVNWSWKRYFFSIENRSMILTIFFVFLFVFLRSFYEMIHFDPLSPSFSRWSIINYSFLESLVFVFVFSIVLHSPKDKIFKLLMLLVCVIALLVALGMYSGGVVVALFYFMPFYILSSFIAYLSGLLARAVFNFSPLIFKIFALIAILVFPAMTGWELLTYSNPSNLTEAKCHRLGPYAGGKCFDMLARTTNNEIFCEGSGDSIMKVQCYDDITSKLLKEGDLDLSVCLKTPSHPKSTDLRWGILRCIESVASKLDDVSKCDFLTDNKADNEMSSERFVCIKTVAENFIKLDPKARLEKCVNLSDRGNEVSCFIALRDQRGQQTEYYRHTGGLQCDLLSNTDRDLCYFANVIGVKPKQSCSMIIDGEIKRKCDSYEGRRGIPQTIKQAYEEVY